MKLKLLILIPAMFILFGCKDNVAPDPTNYELQHDISEYYLKKKTPKENALKLVKSIDLIYNKKDYELTSLTYYKDNKDDKYYNSDKKIIILKFGEVPSLYYEKTIYKFTSEQPPGWSTPLPDTSISVSINNRGLTKRSYGNNSNDSIIEFQEIKDKERYNIEQNTIIRVDCSEVIAGKMRNGRTIVQFNHYTKDSSPFSTKSQYGNYLNYIKRLVFYKGKLEFFVSSMGMNTSDYTMGEVKYNQPIIVPEWYASHEWES